MPENNTTAAPTAPATAVPASTPSQPTFAVNPQNLSAATVSGVMGATPIENQPQSRSSVAVWIGFGLILVAMAIGSAYYYMTMIEPETGEVLPPEVNVPTETPAEAAAAELEAVGASIDASADLSGTEQDIDAIGAELDTVQ